MHANTCGHHALLARVEKCRATRRAGGMLYSIQRRCERNGLLDPVGGDGQIPGRSAAPLKSRLPAPTGVAAAPEGGARKERGRHLRTGAALAPMTCADVESVRPAGTLRAHHAKTSSMISAVSSSSSS